MKLLKYWWIDIYRINTFNSTLNLYSRFITLNSSRLLINTTIITFNWTIYKNTIIIIFKWSTLIYHNTTTVSYIVTSNGTLKFYSISSTKYSTSTLLNKTCITSLNSSRLLINTILRILKITNSRIYTNTTIRTFNCTICKNSIIISFKWSTLIYINTNTIIWIITFNSTIKLHSISKTIYRTCYLINAYLFSLYTSRLLINTILRRRIITNSWIYINTTIRTFNCTICQNTIIIIFKLSRVFYCNTITISCSITLNSTFKIYSTSGTIYSSRRILINTIFRIINITNCCIYKNTTIRTFNCTSCVYSICFSLYFWRRILINTIFSINSITNSRIYINTTIRTFNFTIYINTIYRIIISICPLNI